MSFILTFIIFLVYHMAWGFVFENYLTKWQYWVTIACVLAHAAVCILL
jgi:hypothetical protein